MLCHSERREKFKFSCCVLSARKQSNWLSLGDASVFSHFVPWWMRSGMLHAGRDVSHDENVKVFFVNFLGLLNVKFRCVNWQVIIIPLCQAIKLGSLSILPKCCASCVLLPGLHPVVCLVPCKSKSNYFYPISYLSTLLIWLEINVQFDANYDFLCKIWDIGEICWTA
jgi:hypothetical protein